MQAAICSGVIGVDGALGVAAVAMMTATPLQRHPPLLLLLLVMNTEPLSEVYCRAMRNKSCL